MESQGQGRAFSVEVLLYWYRLEWGGRHHSYAPYFAPAACDAIR